MDKVNYRTIGLMCVFFNSYYQYDFFSFIVTYIAKTKFKFLMERASNYLFQYFCLEQDKRSCTFNNFDYLTMP